VGEGAGDTANFSIAKSNRLYAVRLCLVHLHLKVHIKVNSVWISRDVLVHIQRPTKLILSIIHQNSGDATLK
jgi:hypothetical protein